MSENMNELDNIIVLNDEEGNEIPFEFLDVIEYNSKEYIVLLPAEDDASEVVIFEIESLGGDDEAYLTIEDEKTLYAVYEIFKEKFKDQINFGD